MTLHRRHCGKPVTNVDHWLVPAALGGPHTLANLVPCCQHDNSSRGAAFGNKLRPRRPLTVAQRRAIAVKRAEVGMPARVPRSSCDW